ncbi:MAG: RNA-directed DNA polymerase [Cytophagales bacterium]|nr:RNA-directed DNA polymerase [Cytophagales bacterium]
MENGVFITGSLSYSDKSCLPIHYVNVTSEDVIIYKNQLVAFFEPLAKNEELDVRGVHKVTHLNSNYDNKIDLHRLPDAEPVETTVKKGKWNNPKELHRQLRIDDMKIPADYKNKLKDLITEYSHCFSRNKYDLGLASFYKARINLKRNFEEKWIASYPVSYKHEKFMDEEVDNMIKADHITKCYYSLWNSPTYLVRKGNQKGGTKFRFVQDARGLNSQCIQDCYELPRIGNLLDRLADAKWLSNLDFQSSFTQIGLETESQPLTAFSYKNERFQWKRLVMGQTSSSAQFSRMINQLFSKIPFESIILYVDDVLLWSSDLDSHLIKLRYVFERLTWGNLKLNPNKTNLCQEEVNFLGHMISGNGVRLAEDRIKAIQELPIPRTVKNLQQFL